MGWFSAEQCVVPISCLLRLYDRLLILCLAPNKDDNRESLHLRIRQPSRGRLSRIFPCRRAVDSSDPPRFLGHSHRSSCDYHIQVETDCFRRRRVEELTLYFSNKSSKTALILS